MWSTTCFAEGALLVRRDETELPRQLTLNGSAALQSNDPVLITSANLGCMTHLASGTQTPVKHWIVALDERLAALGTP